MLALVAREWETRLSELPLGFYLPSIIWHVVTAIWAWLDVEYHKVRRLWILGALLGSGVLLGIYLVRGRQEPKRK